MSSTARGLLFQLVFVILFAQSYTDINLALNKNAMQYSLNPPPAGLWSAGNAVDGNKACSSVDGTQFTLSGRGNPPWWQVDLGLIYIINRIKVYGRRHSNPEQLQGFVIKFSNAGVMDNQFTLPFNQTPETNSYPPDGIFDIRFSATQARYVRLILKRTSIIPAIWQSYPIVICEVEVFGPNGRTFDFIPIIRGNVTVYMGRALAYGNLTYPKDNAIDNSPRTDPDLCDCCSTTADGWWTIDLGRRYLIQAIQIIGRSDGQVHQNKPFTVSVGQMRSNLTQVYSGDPNKGSYTYFITLLPAEIIQVIKVWKKIPALLTICEFKIYGLGCQSKGFCNGTYDMATGECPSCLSGYKGNTCSKACDYGFFGPYCKYACGNCSPGSTCNAQTGICQKGCDYGFNGLHCNQKCEDGWFGDNCNMPCGVCMNGAVCDKVSGNCSGGCVRGRLGNQCISDEKQVEITKAGEGNTVVAVLATLLAVAIIGNVVLLTLYCRRKKETRKEKEDDQNHYTVPGASLPSDYATLDVAEMNNIYTD